MKGAPRRPRQHLEWRCTPAGDDRCGRVCSDFGVARGDVVSGQFRAGRIVDHADVAGRYTFANYQRIFSDTYAAEVFFNSLTMSAIAAVAALLWSFCIVTLLRRQKKQPASSLVRDGVDFCRCWF